MRPRIAVLIGLVLAAATLVVRPAAADDSYDNGRILYVEPGVTLQRANEAAAEEAIANLPFLPGDRVWTDATGRAEFQFGDGSVVRLDRGSKLDYAGDDGERAVLRLWSGSLMLHSRSADVARVAVETPSGRVQDLEQGLVRVDVSGGEARISVYEGEAAFDDGQGTVRLAAGERTWARWGERASEPEAFDRSEADAFAQWDANRDSQERWAAASSSPYLPQELEPYAGELDRNGAWHLDASVGYVWTPYVTAGWQPYSSGYWDWTPYGWTWIPYESWGWVPSHYGRWGFSASLGWYWSPGRTWGAAWVSWGVGGGYVSWCPLGRHDRPVTPWPGRYERDRAVPRFGRVDERGWNAVRADQLGHRDLGRRVGLSGLDLAGIRIADSASLRPGRDGRSLRNADAFPGIVRHKLVPGDFVRELAVDNKTTIPASWPRSGETRVDSGRQNARRETANGRATERRRDNVAAAPATSSARSVAPRTAPSTSPRRRLEAQSQASSPAPSSSLWSRLRGGRDNSSARVEAQRPRSESNSSDSSAARSRAESRRDSSSSRPRAESRSDRGARPRAQSRSDGGSRPRAETSSTRGRSSGASARSAATGGARPRKK
jgi:hypothetical protein